jgi:mono/diheme cytochrome c family protein
MKRLVTWLGLVLTALFALAGVGVAYLYVAFPAAPASDDRKVVATPDLLARGEYLVEHVALCTDCHSERDFGRFSGPVRAGSEGKGGERFGRELGLPGDLYARNITPSSIGHWTDGELKRAIVSGVDQQGNALFPVMPYPALSHLCERDLDAIVAYIRTLRPVEHEVPERTLDFPFNLLVRTMPTAPEPWRCSDAVSGAERGRYLVTMGSCTACHTRREQGKPVPGMEFAGGVAFPLPSGGVVRSANLTPDASGLASWSKEVFVARFRAMRAASAAYPVKGGEFNSPMPWTMYAGMTDEDLGAIYDYLRTLAPVKNEVERFTR